ncbi:hypothetical protein ASE66_24680 [Bosea sp. Root483D1]|nr:hypothetical protein ASE66_24680 [Bosea sp. Root483D1]
MTLDEYHRGMPIKEIFLVRSAQPVQGDGANDASRTISAWSVTSSARVLVTSEGVSVETGKAGVSA